MFCDSDAVLIPFFFFFLNVIILNNSGNIFIVFCLFLSGPNGLP